MVSEAVEDVDQFLYPSQGKSGNDDLAFFVYRFVDDVLQLPGHLGHGPVDPVAVGAFHQKIISRFGQNWIAQQW